MTLYINSSAFQSFATFHHITLNVEFVYFSPEREQQPFKSKSLHRLVASSFRKKSLYLSLSLSLGYPVRSGKEVRVLFTRKCVRSSPFARAPRIDHVFPSFILFSGIKCTRVKLVFGASTSEKKYLFTWELVINLPRDPSDESRFTFMIGEMRLRRRKGRNNNSVSERT